MQPASEINEVLDALQSDRRRGLIDQLGEKPEVVVGEDTQRIEMIHNHLPKLENLGFVEYNMDGAIVVRRGERWGEIHAAYSALRDAGIVDG